MKIGIDASTIGNKSTGTNRYLRCLLEQLEGSKNEITKLSFGNNNSNNRNVLNSIEKNWYRNFGLRKIVNQSNADCYIFPNYFMPPGINKSAAIVIHDLSFITHPQFYSKTFTTYYNFLMKRTLKQNPIIVTISNHSKKNIIKYLGIDERNILLVQGYSTLSRIIIKNIKINKSERPYFLYVGHIEPRKNLSFMVEGFLKWKTKQRLDYKLKIIGDLWIKSSETISLIKKYKHNPDIEFTGYVSEQQLIEAYLNASAFLHTSFEEGFGFPVLEAMQYELPILCTQGIATEEISSPGSVVSSPTNEVDFLKGLDNLYELVLHNQKVKYNIKYSPSLMAEQLTELLNRMELKLNKNFTFGTSKAANYEEAVEKTFVYSSLFNSGIQKDKIHPQIFDRKLSIVELDNTISNLVSKNILIQNDDSFFLRGNGHKYYKTEKKNINKTKLTELLKFIKKLPLVSAIAFSGGTANYGPENHDDLDLFIITKPDAVYAVYLMIHLYSIFFKVRKELCANYLIDETNLRIDNSLDFYTAHQIISLAPFKNETMLNLFWNKNEWVKNFFPNFNPKINSESENYLNRNYFLKLINKNLIFCYKFFYRKKLNKMKRSNSIQLTEHCIKLHTNDHKEKISIEFEKAWSNYLLNKKRRKFLKTVEVESDYQTPIIQPVYIESLGLRRTA